MKYEHVCYCNLNRDTVGIIMAHCERSLMNLLDEANNNKTLFSEQFVWWLLYRIADGLWTLHTREIIHRDITPSNILFLNGMFMSNRLFLI